MNHLHLYLPLICLLPVWSIGFAANCNDKQFEKNEICCDVCPPGQYVKAFCTEDQSTVCSDCLEGYYSEHPEQLQECQPCRKCEQDDERKCTLTTNTQCSCRAGFLCSNHVCSKCQTERKCRKGEEMKRKGVREYAYECVPCHNSTYSDTGEGACKLLTKCSDIGLAVRFPGNRSHNSVCHVHAQGDNDKDVSIIQVALTSTFCLFGFVLLTFISQACIKRVRQRRHKAMEHPAAIISVASPETCDCLLSKEETGHHLVQQADTKVQFQP